MKLKANFGTLLLAGIAIFLFLYPVNVLRIQNHRSGEILYHRLIKLPYQFAISINHSVHKSIVIENYEIRVTGELVLTSALFKDLGWGMSSVYSIDHDVVDGVLTLEDIDQHMTYLPFRVSYISEPKLILNHMQPIDLKDYVDDHDRLDFSVQRMSLLKYAFQNKVNVF